MMRLQPKKRYRSWAVAALVPAWVLAGAMALANAPDFKPELIEADELIGMDVKNPEGESLGEVEEIVLDRDRSRIAYAVVDTGGFFGIGRQLIAVPWEALSKHERADHLVLDIEKDRFEESASSFDNDDIWPVTASHQLFDAATMKETRARWGTTANQKRATVPDDRFFWSYKLSELLGLTARTAEGDDLGESERLTIDAQEGRLAYASLSTGDLLEVGDRCVTVPWSVVNVNPAAERMVVEVDRETLAELAYAEGDEPDLRNAEMARRIHRSVDQEPYWVIFGYVPMTPAAGEQERREWSGDDESHESP